MTASQPAITLNNGVELPALGFGVFQTPPEQTQAAVEEALRIGYRMVDTAASYGNEREVGAAIAASGLERSDIFVQTKLWVTNYGYDGALHGFDVSLRKLGLETVNLYLLHQPLPQAFDDTVGAYKAAERLLAEGRAGDRHLELQPRAPRVVHAPGQRRPGSQPGRGAPLLQPARAAPRARAPRDHDPGLVAAGWGDGLPG